MAVKNTAGVRVGGNSFEDHPPVAGTPAIRQPAIYAEDIRGGQIKDNDFYHRHIGFHGVGNLGVFNSQDFVISCNHFVHNETCMLFDPTAISPQANGGFAVDNTFAVLFGLPVPFTSVNNLSSLPLIYNYSNQSPDTNPISTSWSPNNIIPLLVTNPVFSACALQKSQIEIIKSYTRIYPNPVTSNSITINLENDYSEYQIFDLQGRVLKKGDLHFGVNSIAINLSSGTYFYSIINKQNQSVENGKIIIL